MTAIATPQSTLPLRPGRWTADPAHSAIHFSVRHLGLSNVRGRFESFDAAVEVGETLADVQVEADVDMSSVATGNADRDAHLRSTDFFDVEHHPRMSFRSASIDDAGDGEYRLHGDLTVNGITRPVSLDVEFFGTEVFPGDERTHAGFSATTSIRRSDFGIDFGLALGGDKVMLGDKIKVELDLQLVEPAGQSSE